MNETLAGCVESVRDIIYSWIAAATIVGTFSGGLVVVRGELTAEFLTEKGMMYCSTSNASIQSLSRRAALRASVTLANLDLSKADVLTRKREWGLRATKMCRKKFDGNGKRKKGGKTVERQWKDLVSLGAMGHPDQS